VMPCRLSWFVMLKLKLSEFHIGRGLRGGSTVGATVILQEPTQSAAK
jgi:hypothetical protein